MLATGKHKDEKSAALCNTPLHLRRGGYPGRDVEGAVPYEGERTRRGRGKCGAMGEVAGDS